jgi:hypothetical protein
MNLYNLLTEECRKLNLPGFEVSDRAPETLADVMQHYALTGRLKVWSGASEATIWTPQGNWQFRAWHDWCHVLALGTFDRAGEALVCRLQQAQTESSYMQRALEIEIMGQLSYFETHGHFPVDQVQFFVKLINGGGL